MKNFVYFLSILLASTAGFAGGSDDEKDVISRSDKLRKVSSDRSMRSNAPIDAGEGNASSSKSSSKRDLKKEWANEILKLKEKEFRESLPPYTQFVDLDYPWGFNLEVLQERAERVRRFQNRLVSVDNEPTTQLWDIAVVKSKPRLAPLFQLTWTQMQEIAQLTEQKGQLETQRHELRETINKTPKDDEEIQILEGKIVSYITTRRAFVSQLNLDSLNADTVCEATHSVVRSVKSVLGALKKEDENSFGITAEHILQIPSFDTWSKKISEPATLSKGEKNDDVRSFARRKTQAGLPTFESLEEVYGRPRSMSVNDRARIQRSLESEKTSPTPDKKDTKGSQRTGKKGSGSRGLLWPLKRGSSQDSSQGGGSSQDDS